MLPKINGYELMEYAKSIQLPVIFITAMDSTENKVKGLKMGAEDYLAKPFEIVELLARVEAVLRRCNKIGRMLHILDVDIDLSSRTVMQDNQQILLTLKEYELLLFFARNPNIALYREVIYEQVWEKEYTGDSFRDLTRIAKINENLWTELFLMNKDVLVNEITAFVDEINDFKQKLMAEDVDGMKQKFIQSTKRRKYFDK